MASSFGEPQVTGVVNVRDLDALRSFAVFSRGIARLEHLETFLKAEQIVFRPKRNRNVHAVLTWGSKATGHRARDFAHEQSLPLLRLEDGFFRSIRPGSDEPPLTLCIDDVGIYYDARAPSRLENFLNAPDSPEAALSEELVIRSERAIDFVRAHRLSKYNHGHELRGPLTTKERILVVDQTQGDASIECGLASARSFEEMVREAVERFPHAEIVLKAHPDVLRGKKRGHLMDAAAHPRVTLIAEELNPHALLDVVSHVFTVTSQLGFEALLRGLPVTCFGAPFYCGWGATEDRVVVSRRSRRRTPAEIAAAAWFLYCRAIDPATGQLTEIETVLELLAAERQSRTRAFETGRRHTHAALELSSASRVGETLALGFSKWKHSWVRDFLADPHVTFKKRLKALPDVNRVDRVVVWGAREHNLGNLLQAAGLSLTRVEDGFFRSRALGSDLIPALSLVLDGRGIYYDPRTPSDLEVLLETRDVTPEQLARGSALRQLINTQRLSKYNVQTDATVDWGRTGRPIVLVIGQVDDDASVLLGGGPRLNNAVLVHAARQARPEAFLVYKPHPDVLAGHRPGALPPTANGQIDAIETEASILACLDGASEVHTISSLVGFEALCRGVPVVAHGRPFYAGWGLTEDRMPLPHRTRRRALDELVYLTLVEYPFYRSQSNGHFISPERALAELQEEIRQEGRGQVTTSRRRRLQRALRWLCRTFA